MVVILGITTLVEKEKGTAFVSAHIYHSAWFFAVWCVLALMLLAAIIKMKLWKRLSLALLHGSFLIILAGAATTYFTSQKGYVHLLQGQKVGGFVDEDMPTRVHELPFTMQLDSFSIRYYPGTEAPMDYISCLKVTPSDGKAESMRISMNSIGKYRGYRLYQSSFDEGNKGSWISVNYDPWGTGLSYFGYLLMGLSMVTTLAGRKEEFRRLLHHPLLRKSAWMLLLGFLLHPAAMQASPHVLPAFNREKADSLSYKQVIYNDRVVPFNTLATDFVLKLTGKTSYGGLTPEQVVSGWLLRPDAWQHEPMILIKSKELRDKLHLSGRYAKLTDLFDGDTYLLQLWWKGNDAHELQKSSLQKAIEETDEKVGMILMLQNGTLIKPLPADGSVRPLSEAKVKAEIGYNKMPLAKVLFMFNLIMGLLAFCLLIMQGTREGERPHGQSRKQNICKRATSLCHLSLWISLLLISLLYGLRWYIAGRIPLSNGYETMIFLAWCTTAVSTFLYRRFAVMLPFGLLLSGFSLLVAYLGQMNPQITPLVPVLLSPWLSLHVSTVMLSYALLAFIFLDAIVGLCQPEHAERLMLLSRLLLYPAVFLLGIGIFLGAVWANQAWGSYWSWDPKETWALITFMIYGVAFHDKSIRWLQQPKQFHLFALLAFLTVLMTYVGVNYFLTGMHSYA